MKHGFTRLPYRLPLLLMQMWLASYSGMAQVRLIWNDGRQLLTGNQEMEAYGRTFPGGTNETITQPATCQGHSMSVFIVNRGAYTMDFYSMVSYDARMNGTPCGKYYSSRCAGIIQPGGVLECRLNDAWHALRVRPGLPNISNISYKFTNVPASPRAPATPGQSYQQPAQNQQEQARQRQEAERQRQLAEQKRLQETEQRRLQETEQKRLQEDLDLRKRQAQADEQFRQQQLTLQREQAAAERALQQQQLQLQQAAEAARQRDADALRSQQAEEARLRRELEARVLREELLLQQRQLAIDNHQINMLYGDQRRSEIAGQIGSLNNKLADAVDRQQPPANTRPKPDTRVLDQLADVNLEEAGSRHNAELRANRRDYGQPGPPQAVAPVSEPAAASVKQGYTYPQPNPQQAHPGSIACRPDGALWVPVNGGVYDAGQQQWVWQATPGWAVAALAEGTTGEGVYGLLDGGAQGVQLVRWPVPVGEVAAKTLLQLPAGHYNLYPVGLDAVYVWGGGGDQHRLWLQQNGTCKLLFQSAVPIAGMVPLAGGAFCLATGTLVGWAKPGQTTLTSVGQFTSPVDGLAAGADGALLISSAQGVVQLHNGRYQTRSDHRLHGPLLPGKQAVYVIDQQNHRLALLTN